MLLINKHTQTSSNKLRGLINFAAYNVGYKTDHICVTVTEKSGVNTSSEDAVTIDVKYLNPRGEDVCCTELFPDYEEVVGDKYGCGISIAMEVCIDAEATVDREVEIEHVRLQHMADTAVPVESWEAWLVYEMAKKLSLLREGVIGQFIPKRHWWYRTKKHALERLISWNAKKHTYGDDVDLFENVFRLKDAPRVAERLHDKFCNSMDCDWDYHDWNDEQPGFERGHYKEIAEKLLKKGLNITEAMLVLSIWEGKDDE